MKKGKLLFTLSIVLLISTVFAFSANKFGKDIAINHSNPIRVTVKKKLSFPTREFSLFSKDAKKIPFIVNILDDKNYVVVPLEKVPALTLQVSNPSNITAVSEYKGEIFVQTKENLYKLKEVNNQLYFPSFGMGRQNDIMMVEDSIASMETSPSATNKSASAGSSSETNVQVKGVDEADIVKVVGNNIFYVRNNIVNIVTVNNGKFVGQSSLKFDDNFFVRDIYVDKNRLVAIGDATGNGYKYYAQAVVYDISNLNSPKKYRTVKQEGHYSSSRKINNEIYLVTETYLNSRFRIPTYMDSAVSNEYKDINLKTLRFFPPYNPNSIVTISNFSTINKNASNITSFMGSANDLYMNNQNIYISYVEHNYIPIMPVPYAEGKANDEEEIISVTPDDYFTPKTVIKKFSLNKKLAYVGEARIVGTLINQFAMDEQNGYFRVAYTRDFEKGSEVAVFDKSMKEVGKLQAIAPTERIYSARFMGDRLYLVTFKETDPFFVIDLKNPKKPAVLGYLKIPGFSNYLHPYDKNHIIGFGNSTEESQYGSTVTNGMKIAMFDVSDVKNPIQISNVEIGAYGTYSELMYNHKALMYNVEQKYFGFPIRVTEKMKGDDIWDTKPVFVGGFVYGVTDDFKLQFKGKTTHIENITNEQYYEYDYYGEIRRLVYVGDYIYSISDKGISSNKASDMSFVQKVEWSYK